MNDCGWLSDRIPGVTLGQSQWTPEEVLHLDGCADCRQEAELVRAAAGVGRGVMEKVKPDALAGAVLQRLSSARKAERLRRRTWSVAGLAAAAAILAAVWSGGMGRTESPSAGAGSLASAPLTFPLPELESLQPAELDSVLRTMDEPAFRESTTDDPDLGDLNADELERVLDSWEG